MEGDTPSVTHKYDVKSTGPLCAHKPPKGRGIIMAVQTVAVDCPDCLALLGKDATDAR